VTQRLSNAKEVTSKPAALHSHEDLAKKLQVNHAFAILASGVMCLSFFFSMVVKIVIINSDDYLFFTVLILWGRERIYSSIY
jgi:hypothetical protein